MTWPDPLSLWKFAVGATCGVACALLGCFLVLRRMSLIGDGISHGVLPGLFLAYFLGGGDPTLLFVGAVVFGLLTAFLTQLLATHGRVAEDASLGIVFTSLFAVGVVLIAKYARRVHIDVDCVLVGDLETDVLRTQPVAGVEVPSILLVLLVALALVLGFLGLCWKELKLSSFDAQLSTSMGFPAAVMHYALMAMVSLVTVASFRAVGSILVIAMLIVPAATAQMLTDRLRTMLLVASGSAVLSALLGVLAADALDVTTAGTMAVAAGGLFTLAVLFGRHGVVRKVVDNLRLSLRIAAEDVLATLYRREEQSNGVDPLPREECVRVAGEGLVGRLAVGRLVGLGRVHVATDGGVTLTDDGRRAGAQIVRSHRLWESYLDQHFELDADHLHEPAERIEHYIGPELRERMADSLDAPDRDPHGRAIPHADDPKPDEPAPGDSGSAD